MFKYPNIADRMAEAQQAAVVTRPGFSLRSTRFCLTLLSCQQHGLGAGTARRGKAPFDNFLSISKSKWVIQSCKTFDWYCWILLNLCKGLAAPDAAIAS